MAGYYEMKGKQGCWENWFDSFNQGVLDRTLDVKAWMRPVPKCKNTSLGTTCSFYGPMNVPRTTRSSFLQGRGQVENHHCPDCGVRYLPEAVFAQSPEEMAYENTPDCELNTLTPQFTRQPKSCFNISETEITTYAMMPGAYQKGYTGFNSVCDVHMQDREDARRMYRAGPQTPADKMTNYGSYNTYYDAMAMAN